MRDRQDTGKLGREPVTGLGGRQGPGVEGGVGFSSEHDGKSGRAVCDLDKVPWLLGREWVVLGARVGPGRPVRRLLL